MECQVKAKGLPMRVDMLMAGLDTTRSDNGCPTPVRKILMTRQSTAGDRYLQEDGTVTSCQLSYHSPKIIGVLILATHPLHR